MKWRLVAFALARGQAAQASFQERGFGSHGENGVVTATLGDVLNPDVHPYDGVMSQTSGGIADEPTPLNAPFTMKNKAINPSTCLWFAQSRSP